MNRATTHPHKVLSLTNITPTVFILRIERKGIQFRTGQHINVGPEHGGLTREYSIYSGEKDDYIEVLVKEIPDGAVTPVLRSVKTGDLVMVEAPMGYFYLPVKPEQNNHFLFVATGTGIAPYHSFIKTYSDIRYTLLHGITGASEACQKEFYHQDNLILCTSRSNDGDYNGYVTEWIKENNTDQYSHIYLCGNRKMINDAHTLITEKGFPPGNIHAEAYF